MEKIMDKQTVALVQSTWQKVAAIAPQAAELFYQNLFNADPSLKPLFKAGVGCAMRTRIRSSAFAPTAR